MERRKFVRSCGYGLITLPVLSGVLTACGSIYFATTTRRGDAILVSKAEFLYSRKGQTASRDFVLVQLPELGYPICLFHLASAKYVAVLLKCTHRGCELDVGGGVYTCPCHGSTFTTMGQVLEGPADRDLQVFETQSDSENVYIYLS